MVYRVLPLLVVALAVVLFMVAPVGAADKAAADTSTHEGTVVSVKGDKLVMAGKNGKEHTHMLAEDAKVTCDGKTCKLEDLKPGQKIRVTTKKGDAKTALRIEALDKNKAFDQKNQ